MPIRTLTVFVGLFVLLVATTSSAQKGQKPPPPPPLVILDPSVSPDGSDLPPLIGPLSVREIESDVPSHQPARSAISVTTTSARA